MRATRALLVDRIGRVKHDALTTQDLEAQAYLFKAALSELRTESSMHTRNETAAMRTATTALRRETDTLNTLMKEDIATLKHDLIEIGELKTQVEESRWEKMKAAVGALGALLLVIIVSMEVYVVQPKAAEKRAKQLTKQRREDESPSSVASLFP
ncbi:uncharacterized protein BXZ73DRAFT_97115 [Epithele typhae]|uniref:uncharacterized protein n=1 Tax=Epithele typhae TaxID=378194 RepID=UPI0020074C2B|nr:uncharacterized protein BXZ73DRAFT_97115 [Epithele typhae]KAH9943054.1 hypothetical protein BXZ73DRAFT_97115 [Epithele typhae]